MRNGDWRPSRWLAVSKADFRLNTRRHFALDEIQLRAIHQNSRMMRPRGFYGPGWQFSRRGVGAGDMKPVTIAAPRKSDAKSAVWICIHGLCRVAGAPPAQMQLNSNHGFCGGAAGALVSAPCPRRTFAAVLPPPRRRIFSRTGPCPHSACRRCPWYRCRGGFAHHRVRH